MGNCYTASPLSRTRLRQDQIAQPLLELVEDGTVTRIVALGLGNFSTGLKPCSQLGLLLALREAGSIKEVTAFDPVFTAEERLRLESLGIQVSPDYSVLPGTMFYMIHCHLDLYESVLAQCRGLNFPIFLVSNSLRSYGPKLQLDEVRYRQHFSDISERELTSADPAFNDTYLVRVRA